MRKLTLLLALLSICAANALAQVTNVSGVVLDSENDEPIIGATVRVDGTTIAAATDLDGHFTLSGLPKDHQKITVTYVGYDKQTLKAEADMTIRLVSRTEMMDEVIVVAFGKQKRESFTGAATVVSSSEIEKQQVNNPLDALKGVVPGLQMTDNNSVGTGSGPTIRVRGFSSLNASNDPLVVVDGFPYSGYLTDINPSDIETMTVLKDAASNALYGARGANGVIMITTKNAKKGKAKVTLDAKWGANTNGRVEYDIIDNPGEYYEAYYMALRNNFMYRQENPLSATEAHIKSNNTLPLTNSFGGLSYIVYDVPVGEFLIGSNGRLNPHALLGNRVAYGNEVYTLYPDDWMKEGTRNGFRQEYNLNMSGSGDNYTLMASMGYLDNNGISKESWFKRFNARIKASYDPVSFIHTSMNAGYTNSNQKNLGSVFAVPYILGPIFPLYMRDGDGNFMYDRHGRRYDYGNYDMGAYRYMMADDNYLQDDILNKGSNSNNAFNIQGAATADFLNGFHFTVNGSVNVSESRQNYTTNPYYGFPQESGGSTSVGHYRTTDTNFQQLLNYSRTFGPHNVDVLLGHEYSRTTGTGIDGNSTNIADYNWNTELSGAITQVRHGSYRSLYNVEGWFGRAQYDYESRWFGSVSYRRDGSSHFHPKHRWGNFWSVGGAWIMSKAEWFPKNNTVNMLKLKASYGEQGNDGIGNFRYADMFSVGNVWSQISMNFYQKGKENISWEKVGSFNTGVEFELFNNRLNGGVEYYWRKTSDMLMWLTAPYEIGYDGYYDNVGDMANYGIEGNISADIIATKNFTWNLGLNFAWQVNRITYIPDEKVGAVIDGHAGYIDLPYFYAEGLPMYSFYCKNYAGVDENGTALYYKNDADGNKVTTTDYSQADYYLSGNAMPTLFGGFSTSFSFYGFDIAAQFSYSIGGKKWDSGYNDLMTAPTEINAGKGIHRDVFKAWNPSNTTSEIPMWYFSDAYSGATSDRVLKDASYLSFRNLSIGYTLPKNVTSRLRLSKVRFYGLCENVCYFTARRGFDPRDSLTAGSYGNWPVMRTISGGLQIEY